MTETGIIETLKPKCNGYDLPLSLDVEYIAKLLIEKQDEVLNTPYVNNSICSHEDSSWNRDAGCFVCDKCGIRI